MNGIVKREIVKCIIFSIITFGIYGLYWLVKLNDETNILANDQGATSGGMVILLTIVTFGIYGLYWLYKMGGKMDQIRNNQAGNSAVLYIILGVFGLSIVAYCIMQDNINKTVAGN